MKFWEYYNMLKGFIPIIGGIYGLLFAYGKIKVRPEDKEKVKLRLRKFGKWLKIISVCLILVGAWELYTGLPPSIEKVNRDFKENGAKKFGKIKEVKEKEIQINNVLWRELDFLGYNIEIIVFYAFKEDKMFLVRFGTIPKRHVVDMEEFYGSMENFKFEK